MGHIQYCCDVAQYTGMKDANFGLDAQPFHTSGRPLTFVTCAPQRNASTFIERTLQHGTDIALLHGAAGVGKTSLVQQLIDRLGPESASAYVDGEGLYASQLLSNVLSQFGYDVSLRSTGELLNLLQVFLTQQNHSGSAPLLIVDNLNRMLPGALSALCKIAAVRNGERSAMRMVLVGDSDCHSLLQSASMAPVARRIGGRFEMQPLSAQESQLYLYMKLRAAGAMQPDDLLPVDACDAIIAEADGYPRRLDKAATRYLECGETKSIAPRLVVTRDGDTLQDVELVANRLLIGRSELCDILLSDQFASKYHALVIWNENLVILVDLKSSNGTFVNSRRARTQILHHNDIISIGDHRIKLIYEVAGARGGLTGADLADTAKMKSIADARRARALRHVGLRLVEKGS